MKIKHTIKTAFIGLGANKVRSFLTILGIVIGVTSIIIIMAIGAGAKKLILNQVQAFGSNMLVVLPGKESGRPGDFSLLFNDSLKEKELKALQSKENIPTALDVTPWSMVPGKVAHGAEILQATTFGTTELFGDVLNIEPSEGSFFTDIDVKRKSRVAVIGNNVKEKLFKDEIVLGEKIKIKDVSFRVIGILPPKGNMLFLNVDDLVAIPYTAAQKYLTGETYFNEVIVRTENEEVVSRTVHDIKATLRELHNITDPDKDDFHIHTQADMIERIGLITGILTALLMTVAAISLIVGGIGIMNIMIVSVTERTREIGLRKAIGATNANILVQFLLEAILLTGIGGLIGILLGAMIAFLASIILTHFMDIAWKFTFPISAAVLGIAVSSFVGMVFGLYPASQAARKSPIEALRYE